MDRLSHDYRVRNWSVGILLIVLLIMVAGCATGGDQTTTTPVATPETTVAPVSTTATTIPPADGPIGIVAIGHSGLTGEGAGVGGSDAKEFSWATGTSAEVNSVYTRLVAADATYEGHVANTATGGALATALASQARQALARVPMPSLVIVATIDNDIRCDGTDEKNVMAFGEAVADALTVITDASPETNILILNQRGNPAGYATMLEELGATIRETGDGMCDLFVPATGERNGANIETLIGIIGAYEAEAARICEQFANCVTDGGLLTGLADDGAYYSADLNHLNRRGQAWMAETVWPLVVDILGLPSE